MCEKVQNGGIDVVGFDLTSRVTRGVGSGLTILNCVAYEHLQKTILSLHAQF